MKKSFKYKSLLGLCRLFRLQKIMELPPEKAQKLFKKAYKGVIIPEMHDDRIDIKTEQVFIKARLEKYGVHVKMEVAPGMYHCYAVMPFVKEAMPAYHRMIKYINGG